MPDADQSQHDARPWAALSAGARFALLGLLLACAALFVWRGPLRAAAGGGSYDLVWMYSASRAWAMGGNPYDLASADSAFVAGDGPTDRARFRPVEREAGASGLIYPPTTFVVMAPVAALPWRIATIAWGAANIAAFGAAAWALLRLAGLRARSARGIALLAACLAFAPVHTALAFGQTAMLPVALVLLAQVAARRERPALAGALLAIACALKPQLAGLFVVLEAMRGRWRVVASAAITGAFILAIGAGTLWARGIDWPAALRANIEVFQQSGVGSPTAVNPLRFQMVNLQYPLHELLASRGAVTAITLGGGALLLLALALSIARDQRGAGQAPASANCDWAAIDAGLLGLTVVSCISLMVVYHRYYDAALLLPGLALAATTWGRWPLARWALVAIPVGAFMLNGTAALYKVSLPGAPLEQLAKSDVWRIALMPHQAWLIAALGAICVGLRWSLGRTPRREAEPRSPA